MKVDVETLSATRRKLRIQIPAEDVRKQYAEAVANVAKTVQVPGFRPSRVPKALVRARYGAAIKTDVLQDIVPAACQEAVEENKIVVVGEVTLVPTLDEMELPEDEFLDFTLEVEVKPPLDIPAYSALEIDKTAPNVPGEEVDDYVERVRQSRATYGDIHEERPAAKGDTVYVDWRVQLVGSDEEYNHQHDYIAEVGSGALFDEVDEALVGMSAGDETTVRVTYPDDFGNEELAGKEADIAVTLNKLATRIVPDVDDEFAQSLEFDGVEQMRASYWNRLIEQRKSETRVKVEREIVDQLIANTDFEVPEALILDRRRDLLTREFEGLGRRGDDLDQPEVDQLVEASKEAAERSIREEWVLDEIAQNEDIEADEADVDQLIARDAAQAGMDPDEYAGRVAEAGRRDRYERFMRDRQVFDLLIEQASQKNVIIVS